MMTLWVGPAGSGKSLHGVGRTLRDLSRGLHVYTNLPIVMEGVEKYFEGVSHDWRERLHVLSNDDMCRLPDMRIKGESERRPAVVRWDEASEGLDSYFNGKDLFGLLRWIRFHRHYYIEIELLTQDITLLQARIRTQAHQVWRHTHGSNLTWGPGWSLGFLGRRLLVTQRMDKNCVKPLGRRLWATVDMEWARCYKSDSEDLAGEVTRLRSTNTEVDDMTRGQRRIMAAGFVCGVLGLLLSVGAVIYAFKAIPGHAEIEGIAKSAFQSAGGDGVAKQTGVSASLFGGHKARAPAPDPGFGGAISSRGCWILKDGKIVKLPVRKKAAAPPGAFSGARPGGGTGEA